MAFQIKWHTKYVCCIRFLVTEICLDAKWMGEETIAIISATSSNSSSSSIKKIDAKLQSLQNKSTHQKCCMNYILYCGILSLREQQLLNVRLPLSLGINMTYYYIITISQNYCHSYERLWIALWKFKERINPSCTSMYNII